MPALLTHYLANGHVIQGQRLQVSLMQSGSGLAAWSACKLFHSWDSSLEGPIASTSKSSFRLLAPWAGTALLPSCVRMRTKSVRSQAM